MSAVGLCLDGRTRAFFAIVKYGKQMKTFPTPVLEEACTLLSEEVIHALQLFMDLIVLKKII